MTTERHFALNEKNQSGQAAVFGMLGLLLLFLGVVLLAQLGLLTHHAQHAQAVADTSALSGAVTQAASLNQMARLNDQIVEDFEELQWVCASTLFPSREAARLVIETYELKTKLNKEAMNETNRSGATLAQENAHLTCLLNSDGQAAFQYLGTDDLKEAVLPDDFTRWESRQIVYQYIQVVGNVVVIVVETDTVQTWMEKDTSCLTAFAAGCQWEEQPAFRGEGTLGPLPALRTAAQAKPYGGRMYRPSPFYRVKLIALNALHSPFRRRWGRKAAQYEH